MRSLAHTFFIREHPRADPFSRDVLAIRLKYLFVNTLASLRESTSKFSLSKFHDILERRWVALRNQLARMNNNAGREYANYIIR